MTDATETVIPIQLQLQQHQPTTARPLDVSAYNDCSDLGDHACRLRREGIPKVRHRCSDNHTENHKQHMQQYFNDYLQNAPKPHDVSFNATVKVFEQDGYAELCNPVPMSPLSFAALFKISGVTLQAVPFLPVYDDEDNDGDDQHRYEVNDDAKEDAESVSPIAKEDGDASPTYSSFFDGSTKGRRTRRRRKPAPAAAKEEVKERGGGEPALTGDTDKSPTRRTHVDFSSGPIDEHNNKREEDHSFSGSSKQRRNNRDSGGRRGRKSGKSAADGDERNIKPETSEKKTKCFRAYFHKCAAGAYFANVRVILSGADSSSIRRNCVVPPQLHPLDALRFKWSVKEGEVACVRRYSNVATNATAVGFQTAREDGSALPWPPLSLDRSDPVNAARLEAHERRFPLPVWYASDGKEAPVYDLNVGGAGDCGTPPAKDAPGRLAAEAGASRRAAGPGGRERRLLPRAGPSGRPRRRRLRQRLPGGGSRRRWTPRGACAGGRRPCNL